VLTSAVGFVASGILYLVAIYGFVWMGTRRMDWGARHGVALSPQPKCPSVSEIWSRHSVEMTVIYGALFVALALMDFTSLQRVGFAALSALVFGYWWVANSQIIEGLPGMTSGRKVASNFGYWCLAVADWFGYFGLLCFGTALVVEAF
jgi:hypothetical protein